MSGNVINMRQARKRRQRADKSARADENRVKFGRSKPEREQAAKAQQTIVRRLDGHKRDHLGVNDASKADVDKTFMRTDPDLANSEGPAVSPLYAGPGPTPTPTGEDDS